MDDLDSYVDNLLHSTPALDFGDRSGAADRPAAQPFGGPIASLFTTPMATAAQQPQTPPLSAAQAPASVSASAFAVPTQQQYQQQQGALPATAQAILSPQAPPEPNPSFASNFGALRAVADRVAEHVTGTSTPRQPAVQTPRTPRTGDDTSGGPSRVATPVRPPSSAQNEFRRCHTDPGSENIPPAPTPGDQQPPGFEQAASAMRRSSVAESADDSMLLHRMAMWAQRRQQQFQLRKREAAMNEMAECTFSPGRPYEDPVAVAAALRPSPLYENNEAWGFDKFVQRQAAAREMRDAKQQHDAEVFKSPGQWRNKSTVPKPFALGVARRDGMKKDRVTKESMAAQVRHHFDAPPRRAEAPSVPPGLFSHLHQALGSPVSGRQFSRSSPSSSPMMGSMLHQHEGSIM